MLTGPISIGMAFASGGPYLRAAVASVFAQSIAEWELILVSDGASDSDVEWARSIADKRVRVYSDGRQLGLAKRLNQIAGLAKYSLLARMDADDIMFRERLSVQAKLLVENPALDVVGTRAVVIDESSFVVGLHREPDLPQRYTGYLRSLAFTHPTVMGRTHWFQSYPYDEHIPMAEDKALWMATATRSNFLKVERPLLFYRIPRLLSVEKQSRSSQSDRMAIRTYGSKVAGPIQVRSMLLRSRLREAVYAPLIGAGGRGWLYKRRYTPLNEEDLSLYTEELQLLERSAVPLRSNA